MAKLLTFLSFVNCSPISAPVAYGYDEGTLKWFRFLTPQRSVATNRRTWATKVKEGDLSSALTLFFFATENSFWASVLHRAIKWQLLTERVLSDSCEQALFTVQMLLEMLSFVFLVEDAQILSVDGYGRLPAADKITLLCGHGNQRVDLDFSRFKQLEQFCKEKSIDNIGQLIATIRNKLTHPTKRNREYLDLVPEEVRQAAVYYGIQTASLAILKAIDYKGEYFDLIHYKTRVVPWRERVENR